MSYGYSVDTAVFLTMKEAVQYAMAVHSDKSDPWFKITRLGLIHGDLFEDKESHEPHNYYWRGEDENGTEKDYPLTRNEWMAIKSVLMD